MSALSPIQKANRIQVIDVLRGFAIFGILVVNIELFANGFYTSVFHLDENSLNHLSVVLSETLFTGKFYTTFSFLFGLGFSIQMARAEEKGTAFVPLYIRRLLWLMLFGVLHAVLVWNGDILLDYGLLGLILLALRKLKPRTALIVGGVLLLLYGGSLIAEVDYTPEPYTAAEIAEDEAFLAEDLATYRDGTFSEITAARFADWWVVADVVDPIAEEPWLIPLVPVFLLLYTSDILGMFLIGMAFGKLGLFSDLETWLPTWKQIFRWAFPIGLVLNVAYGVGFYAYEFGIGNEVIMEFISTFGLAFGAPLLAFGYISGLVLLNHRSGFASALAPVGRMALTNYLAQSLVFTFIFYGYGLGLYQSVTSLTALAMWLVCCVVQTILSGLWLKHSRYGPFEWLWRSLTYFKLLPIRSNKQPMVQKQRV